METKAQLKMQIEYLKRELKGVEMELERLEQDYMNACHDRDAAEEKADMFREELKELR